MAKGIPVEHCTLIVDEQGRLLVVPADVLERIERKLDWLRANGDPSLRKSSDWPGDLPPEKPEGTES
jgi:hypothetical protein